MKIKQFANRPVLNPYTLVGRNYQVDPYIGFSYKSFWKSVQAKRKE